jgi:hypothetical protein
MDMYLDQTKTAGSERVRYFSRQLITADDMLKEQEYFRNKLRRHNRYLHGWGVVCGCEVEAKPLNDQPWRVQICPGYIITPQGDEIEILADNVYFNLAGDWRQSYDPCAQSAPCPPPSGAATTNGDKTAYLAVCYAECSSRPVRIQADGCSCDDTACEYSRIRESFDLVRLSELPDSHTQAIEADKEWLEALRSYAPSASLESSTSLETADRTAPFPLPGCYPASDDSCVVLAGIALPKKRTDPLGEIHNEVRRTCLSVNALASIFMARLSP